MAQCEMCGNEYDKAFTITFESDPGSTHTVR